MSIAAGDLRTVDSAEGDCPSADAGSALSDSRMGQAPEFYIDGVLKDAIDGEADWDDQSYEITGSGTHSLLWQYTKDGSSSEGEDCGWRTSSSNNHQSSIILHQFPGEPICMIEAPGDYAGTYYYHFDALGSVVALTDADADDVQKYDYSVWGQVGADDVDHPNPYLFTGRRFDTETGLYYYRARYYHPEIGRFLQTDPIGYGAGMNLYTYCVNNPLLFGDPFGRDPTDNNPGIISLCAKTERTFHDSWGMRITPHSSYEWGTGKEFLDGLTDATATYGEITMLNVFSHAWIADSNDGWRHRGGVYGQGPGDPRDSGFYGNKRSKDHQDARDLDDLDALIDSGQIKFAEGGTIFFNGCHVASQEYFFCRELAIETGCTVYAATGKVSEYRIGEDWVQWLAFAEGPETEPITWKRFLPDGTEVDLGTTVLQISEGGTTPMIPVRRQAAAG